ncbi:MAG: mechanosensitive ion channel family protein [Candidatus Gracilibacteria bacterium]|nr:mechanosensitive ion channel family protein [Candidatus Gracilibacteria bacterium]
MRKFLNYILVILYILFFATDKYILPEYFHIIIEDKNILALIAHLNGLLLAGFVFGAVSIFQDKVTPHILEMGKKTKSKLDDIIINFIIDAVNATKIILSLYAGISVLPLNDNFQTLANKFFYISLVIVGTVLGTSLINIVFKKILFKSRRGDKLGLSKQLFPFLNKVLVIFIWVISGITILSSIGYDVTGLIAGAGIGGLAFALAAQKSIANIFGAITIILNKPFGIGDFIALAGLQGTVKDIGITYLTLIDKGGHSIFIPNEQIISNPVENFSIRENRRVDFSIGVTYDTTLDKLKEGVTIIENILEKYVTDEKISSYRVNFDNFGAFSLNINATYFSNELGLNAFLKEKEDINIEVKVAFEKAGIEMAFPTQELIIKNQNT